MDSFCRCLVKVSKSKSKVSETGEAVAKGSGAFSSAVVQWNDEKHSRLQRVQGLPALSASKLDQPLSSSKDTKHRRRNVNNHKYSTFITRISFKWALRPTLPWLSHFPCPTAQTWAPSEFDKTRWVRWIHLLKF